MPCVFTGSEVSLQKDLVFERADKLSPIGGPSSATTTTEDTEAEVFGEEALAGLLSTGLILGLLGLGGHVQRPCITECIVLL